MLNELMAFGKRIRKPEEHDALKQELITADITIDAQGIFYGLTLVDKHPTQAEALQSKKGKARLLLDKAEEVLGLDPKKHALFLQKLGDYRHVQSLQPVLHFYEDNQTQGLNRAMEAFQELPEKQRPKGNFAFRLVNDSTRVHEKDDVQAAIITAFEARQQRTPSKGQLCSICGTADHPIVNQPHGMIKNVPSGQSAGCALVSYNEDAFESYGLRGNENASICTACARNYVEGLNYLLGNGVMRTPEKGKPYYQYSNRKNLSSDTAMIFWTRHLTPVPELNYVDAPAEHTADIAAMIMGMPAVTPAPRAEALLLLLDSPFTAQGESLHSVDVERFYSCMVSGAAARIAVRNWIESTTPQLRTKLAAWFHDIAIVKRDYTSKELQAQFYPLRSLANSCGVHRKKDMNGQSLFMLEKKDDFLGRAATMLWNCALLGHAPPYTMLDRVLRRIRLEEGRVTGERVALLKCILNRNAAITHAGGRRMQAQLDNDNMDVAYNAGRIFAMLESIQTAAQGADLNVTIRDRFFSFASTSPASAFGRLMKLSQTHLSKLRGEKRGLAVILDRKLGELFARVQTFPTIFKLEEQGQFAIGYYHQRQENFACAGTDDSDTQTNASTNSTSKGA